MLQVDRGNIVGRGPVAIVFAGTFGTQSVAVKRFVLMDAHPDWKDKVDECAEKMTALVHPNVVSVKSVHDDEDFRYVVMERCLADLSMYCRNEYDGPVPTHHDGLVQLVSGLIYIHSRGFIHRRLNTPNILVSSPQFKIADFGMTACKSLGSTCISTAKEHSASTEAPELLQLPMSEGEKESHHTAASDTFSLGCLLALFFTRGSHPFGSSRYRVPVNIVENKYNFPADMPYTHIVDQMIKKFPQERIPLDKILSMLKV